MGSTIFHQPRILPTTEHKIPVRTPLFRARGPRDGLLLLRDRWGGGSDRERATPSPHASIPETTCFAAVVSLRANSGRRAGRPPECRKAAERRPPRENGSGEAPQDRQTNKQANTTAWPACQHPLPSNSPPSSRRPLQYPPFVFSRKNTARPASPGLPTAGPSGSHTPVSQVRLQTRALRVHTHARPAFYSRVPLSAARPRCMADMTRATRPRGERRRAFADATEVPNQKGETRPGESNVHRCKPSPSSESLCRGEANGPSRAGLRGRGERGASVLQPPGTGFGRDPGPRAQAWKRRGDVCVPILSTAFVGQVTTSRSRPSLPYDGRNQRRFTGASAKPASFHPGLGG